MATFSEHLRARGDDELVSLLLRRPDLAHPSPSTLASLAARATSRTSLDRALATVDAAVLQVVEAVVALDVPGGPGLPVSDVIAAVAGPSADDADRVLLTDAVARAREVALVWGDADALRPAPGLAEVLGPYPAGLAPAPAEVDVPAPRRTPEGPAAPDLTDAPPGARAVLEALAWGPPVGRLPGSGTAARPGVDWLLARGLLRTTDADHVVLPRDVALALRDGRTHRGPAHPPTPTDSPRHPDATVDAESARAADHVVRLVATLLRAWEHTPPAVLRSGGLGIRDLRRTAQLLEASDDEATLAVELATAAGLVVDDGEDPPAFSPTLDVDAWTAAELPGRWARLVRAWLTTTRATWLVGTRGDRGELRPALDPELHRAWAPRLRRSVLDVLAAVEPGTALSTDQVVAALTWRSPRAVPPAEAVATTLREATALGIVGAGALSPAGRALRTDDGGPALAEALAASLPPAVDEVLVQADLTGIVPGRPTAALAALLDDAARIESRGGAVTVRFTAETVGRALDAGRTADELLGELAAHARGRLPQPLDYLVRDVARRHGRLRVGAATSYVRSEDPALLAGLVDDPRLSDLGLVLLAPTVLAAAATPRELLDALRLRGLTPVAEGPDGQVVHAHPTVRRVRGRRRRAEAPPPAEPDAAELRSRAAALVPLLRRSEPAHPPVPPPVGTGTTATAGLAPVADHAAQVATGTPDPVVALALLREAAADAREVWLEVVGPQGVPSRRRVRPLRVDAGRVRALDTEREAELTVAVHRIGSVTPVDPGETTR